MIPFVDLPSLYSEISYDVEPEIIECLRKGSYTGGHYVERFERNLSHYLSTNHVIGVSSGTDALMLACESLNIGLGDYIIIPNNVYIATAFAVTRAGATPIFVDVHPDTYLIDSEKVETILQTHPKRRRIKGMVVVDLYGQMPDMERFSEIADKYKIFFIEDASQSLGSTFKNKHIGTYSDIATTSFYPSKPLGTCGQGGAIITNDSITARRIRAIINQGCEREHDHIFLGGNYRLDAIMAIQLYHGLKRLDGWNNKRRDLARIYHQNFNSDQRPTQQPSCRHIYHLYEYKCQNVIERDIIEMEFLKNQIGYGLHYPTLITDTPMYANLAADTPVASDLKNKLISLPIHPHLTEDQVLEVILTIQSVVN